MGISDRELPQEFRAAVRTAYRAHRRNRWISGALLAVGLVIVVSFWGSGPWWLMAMGAAVCAAALVLFPARSWRCPSCGAAEVDDEADGRHCRECGMPFT